MWPLSATALQILARSHAIATRAHVRSATLGHLTDLPIAAGSVKVDAGANVRRATQGLALAVDYGPGTLDAFSPVATTVTLEYGIVLPSGTEWVPLLTDGPVQRASRARTDGGLIQLTVHDKTQAVIDDEFEFPEQTLDGATVISEITRLVQETLPGCVVLDLTGSSALAPTLEVSTGRWDTVERLATSIAAEVYFDVLGRLVIRPQPTVDQAPSWDISSDTVLVDLNEEATRERIYNAVVVTGERTDGTDPIAVTVKDLDPDSPTRWGGPFGRKPRRYASPLITSDIQAQSAGEAILARVTGMQAQLTVTAVPNPALDSGDVITIGHTDGRTEYHILDAFDVPLTVAPAQQLGTRTAAIPGES